MPDMSFSQDDTITFADTSVTLRVSKKDLSLKWEGDLKLPNEKLSGLFSRGVFDLSEVSNRFSGIAKLRSFAADVGDFCGIGPISVDGDEMRSS